jgi:catalase
LAPSGHVQRTHDITKCTEGSVFAKGREEDRLFVRSRPSPANAGAADAERNIRGFAIKF